MAKQVFVIFLIQSKLHKIGDKLIIFNLICKYWNV